jgi:riboflavin kinase/FMN adenylyltransferase
MNNMFAGIVVHGDGLGKEFGFPTANLDIPVAQVKLRDGVYAAIATLHTVQYVAALVVKSTIERVEVYLLGYEGEDFYGEEISVDPLQIVSEYETYDTNNELKEKILRDVDMVRTHCIQYGYKDLLPH